MKNLEKTLLGLTVILILICANTQLASAADFTDVQRYQWYYESVNRLVDLGITTGIGDDMFAPDNSVTRAEFVTFLCKANKLKQENGYTYSDTKSHWSRKWISAAITANMIDKGTAFNPNKAIKRQEAVEMLCRTLGLSADTAMANPYYDVTEDTGYSNRAYEEYLMRGSVKDNKKYFDPNGNLERSEAAAVIVNLIDYKAYTTGL